MQLNTVDHEENIVEVKDVSFAYGDNQVLENINLKIHRGDYLGIVGGNGSGKTTLLKLILGILQPTTGEVSLFGTDIRSFRAWSKIGYVPQKVTGFDANFPATVEQVVLMGRIGQRGLFRGFNEDDRDRARQALERVGMWDDRMRHIGNLSGGQQQRVFIARALAGEPEILFLDEPTVGVEQQVRQEFYALLQKLNKDLSLTVVLITHDIESMTHQAMHIACIDKTVFFHDSVDSYFKQSHNITHPHP